MRCLYCGEPLSLLRKLTGKAEFCSEAHREAYQEEFNSLALQRLASQPKQNRRVETAFISAPVVNVAPEIPALPEPVADVSEPFAGLPFPEDPDDFDLDAAEAEAEAPAPLRGFLEDLPPAAGQVPPSYSFPLRLADYPRDCLVSNGVAWGAAISRLPFSGYVDLPEPLDSDNRGPQDLLAVPLENYDSSICAILARPLVRSDLRGLAAPLQTLPLPTEFEDRGRESALAPDRWPLPNPQRLESPAIVLRCWPAAATPALPARFAPTVPLAAPGLFAGEAEALLTEAGFDGWPSEGQIASWCRPRSKVSVPLRKLRSAERSAETCLIANTGAGDPDGAELLDRRENFDVERILIVPLLNVNAQSSLAQAHSLNLEFASGLDTGSGLRAEPMPAMAPFAPGTFAQKLSPFAAVECATVIPQPGLVSLPQGDALALEFSIAVPAEILGWPPATPDQLPATGPAAERHLPPAEAVQPAAIYGNAPMPEECSTASLAVFAAAKPLAIGRPFQVPAVEWPLVAAHQALVFDGVALAPAEEALLLVATPECEWNPGAAANLQRLARRPSSLTSALCRVRVKDLSWPDFAAGCDSLFTPDQPFRFHEVPFAQRGTSDTDRTRGRQPAARSETSVMCHFCLPW